MGVRCAYRYTLGRDVGLGFQSGGKLARYLAAGTNEELQMGGVSGLVDVPGPEAAQALLEHLADLSDHNRTLALDGLLRGEERRTLLLDAVAAKRVSAAMLGDVRRKALLETGSAALRRRARELLGE